MAGGKNYRGKMGQRWDLCVCMRLCVYVCVCVCVLHPRVKLRNPRQ